MSQFNSKGGDQNIAQGDHAIGQENNSGCVKQSVTGDGNVFSGSGNVHVEHHHHPAAPPPIPHQPPSLDTCFLGRDKQLAELLTLLHPGKVVAVCGPGGMGKSALAAQAVHQLEPARFPDGIIFHSFYSHPRIEQALQRIAKAFGIEAKPSLEIAVADALAGRKALLILDGAEEADDLPALLKLRGTCGVLITSRKRSDAQGARLDLKPLEEQDAAAVFREYSGVAADDASVQGICKILGGWPVGLRIAGRYCSSTGESAADYLRFLSKVPFRRLASGEHQEENAALLLRRNVEKVSADARLTLGLAGCLAFAPIAREPVMAVLDDDELRSADALGELVNYGLLETSEERWQVSHKLVHTYAHSELAMSKEELERLAAYYISFCEAANAEGVEGYARLDAERAHCLRLIETCLASELWQDVKLLVGLTYTYLDRQGWWTELLTSVGMSLTAARQIRNHRDEGWCLCVLGYTYWRRGEYDKALIWFGQSLMVWRELDDRHEEGTLLLNIATIYSDQGNHELALQTYQQSLSIQREIGDREGEGTTLNNIGVLYHDQGDNEQALSYFEQCLPIRQEAGDKIGAGQSLNNIAAIYNVQGDYAKAVGYYEQDLAICQQLGNRAGELVTRWNIGLTYKDLGNLAKAEEYISLAVQIAEKIGHPDLEQWREELAQVQAARQG
ncbi:MAG: Tfp pilus assembly protein PilF [Candidatus Electronema aureum]|uniref:Tfp pilus assembly protein PilF n=1 Tax=Candidatus Electronema aureum TaxID=2005002 RepID=A0A521FYG8_9BACT|nr:MAG: Tfp pilus assembly protein PilF [Candidatus Electronema aureum]